VAFELRAPREPSTSMTTRFASAGLSPPRRSLSFARLSSSCDSAARSSRLHLAAQLLAVVVVAALGELLFQLLDAVAQRITLVAVAHAAILPPPRGRCPAHRIQSCQEAATPPQMGAHPPQCCRFLATMPTFARYAAPMDEIPQVPGFGFQFVVMLVGALALVVSGALVRNAVARGERGVAIDFALGSEHWLLVPIGLLMLLVLYPFQRDAAGRRLPPAPYLAFLISAAQFFGPLLLWAWWYGDIPGVAPLGAG
jgi:hypothetical protein